MPDLDDILSLTIGFLASQLIAFAVLGAVGFDSFSEFAAWVRRRLA